MKTNYKSLFAGVAMLFCSPSGAQVSAYLFASSQETYVPITGGTVIATATANAATGNLSGMIWNLPNGSFTFPFLFNGNTYTGCNISCNGHITFGAIPPTNTGNAISVNTAYDGAIVAWGRTNNGAYNLGTGPFYTSEVRVEEIGVAPHRTIVIQYENWRQASGTGTTAWLMDYQIRLVETTNVIEIVYGKGVMVGGSLTTGGFSSQVGLRGATNADFNNRSGPGGMFSISTTGTVNTAVQAWGISSGQNAGMPFSGFTYRWFPPCSSGTVVTPSITALKPVICVGDTLFITANGETPFIDINYQWQVSMQQGGPYTNVTGPNAGTTFSQYHAVNNSGVYYFVLASTCTSVPNSATSNEVLVDVRPLPVVDILTNPILNTAVTPVQACAGQTYTLIATGADTYAWTNGPALDAYVVQPVGNPNIASYTVTGVSIDGCVNSKVIDINMNQPPFIQMQASPDTVCPNQPVVIGATGESVNYIWTTPLAAGFLITVTPSVTTNYIVTGTSVHGCTNAAIHQVVVYQVDPIIAGTDRPTICKGEQVMLSATGANTFTWISGSTYANGYSVNVSPEVTTTYTLTGIDLNGCTSETTVEQIVSECLGINQISGMSANIYPNPNNGLFTIELGNGSKKVVELMDFTGKIVYSETNENVRTDIDISGLAHGVYHLRITYNNTVEIVKVVKQ